MTQIEVSIDVSKLDELSSRLASDLALEIRRAASACASFAQSNVPVQTGALKNSIQARPHGVSDLPPLRRDRPASGALRHASGIPTSRSPMEAWVVTGVNYGGVVERRRGYMARAAQRTEAEFARNCEALLERR